CNGGCYGSGYGSCTGGYGSCYGGGYGSCTGGTIVPATPVTPPMKKDEKKIEKKTMAPTAPATIIVTLPAEAKLTIDDAVTTSTSTRRVFISPELPVGREFHYTLKAEYVKDGKAIVLSKEATVRAGEETTISMDANQTSVASR
ncbi:MAG: TIGR03000 domain-containing protein, partial [Candidatus Acidiferrum sp.]